MTHRATDLTRRRQHGYTYLALLILVAVVGLMSAATLRVGTAMQRRVAEQALLDRGLALTRALESYARATQPGQRPAPLAIEELLHDPRFPRVTVRHLRRIDVDPMTGRSQWGVVYGADGRSIAGFHSLSDEQPHRLEFPSPFEDFEGAKHYKDWVFKAGLGD